LETRILHSVSTGKTLAAVAAPTRATREVPRTTDPPLKRNHPMQRNRSITRSPRATAQAGFSLIEIIIVTVLIGGIVAFAASRILGGGDKARYRLAQSTVQTMAEKVHSYQMDTGSLPGSLEDLVRQPGSASGWLGPYAK